MWTFEVTINFVPLPKENEAAYWAVMQYFASVMFDETNDETNDQKKHDQ